MFQTIKKDTVAEIVEKKSKFIAHIFYIETIQQAEEKIEQIRKKYHDARHNCYAYRIFQQEQIVSKSSDDGEPSGTAGAPMLNILEKNKLGNVLVIVTRYFGGILLGTGGLVRAYSEVTTEALQQVEWVTKELGYEIEVVIEYPNLEKFKYFCKQNKITIIKEEYFDKITILLECSFKQSDVFLQKESNFNILLVESKIIRKKYIEKNIEK